MTTEQLTRFFGTGTLLAFAFMMFWFVMYLAAGDFAYSIHARLFSIDRSLYQNMNYYGMAIFKMLTFIFFLIPYIALKIIGRRKS